MKVSPERYGWDDNKEKFYHPILLPPILDTIRKYPIESVLDAGCGNGFLTSKLAQNGFKIVGCDSDTEGVNHASEFPIPFHNISVYDDPLENSLMNFDCVLSVEVIEHLYSPDALFTFADKALKPGGYLIFSTPYHGYIKNLLLSLFNKWDKHFTSLSEGGHIKFWSYKTIKQLIEKNHFELVEFKGAGRITGLWNSMILVCKRKKEISL